jgi:hypothetical protein
VILGGIAHTRLIRVTLDVPVSSADPSMDAFGEWRRPPALPLAPGGGPLGGSERRDQIAQSQSFARRAGRT